MSEWEAESQLSAARGALAAGDHAFALQLCAGLLQAGGHTPRRAAALLLAGAAARGCGQLQAALAFLDAAVLEAPACAEAHAALGGLLAQLGHVELARRYYQVLHVERGGGMCMPRGMHMGCDRARALQRCRRPGSLQIRPPLRPLASRRCA